VAEIVSGNKTLDTLLFPRRTTKLPTPPISTAGDTIINVLGLKPDKINANGTPTHILTEANGLSGMCRESVRS
jgi:hypothetical protein